MNKKLPITQNQQTNQQNFEFVQKIKDDSFQTCPAILACKG